MGETKDLEYMTCVELESVINQLKDIYPEVEEGSAMGFFNVKEMKYLKTFEALNYDEELRRIAYEGMERRDLERSEQVMERFEYELEVIKNKGYAQYFLVVYDLLKYANDHGIFTNIRGSVAGSLITYLTKISSFAGNT